MQKIILLSFADKRYKKSLDRLKQQTEAFPFDESFFLTQADLSKSYRKSLETWKTKSNQNRGPLSENKKELPGLIKIS